MDSWTPHGLIQKRGLEEPYQNARLSIDIYGNEVDTEEYYTVHLFEDLFNKEIFSGDLYLVNSQPHPLTKEGHDKACDIAIKYIDHQYNRQILCFAETKRGHSKITDLEEQAQGYCTGFLQANSSTDLVYACTLVGESIRCWMMRRGTPGFVGCWDGEQKGDFRHYKDVGLDEDRAEILKAFDMMKSVGSNALRLG